MSVKQGVEDNNSLSSANLSNADSGDSGRGPSEEGEQSFNYSPTKQKSVSFARRSLQRQIDKQMTVCEAKNASICRLSKENVSRLHNTSLNSVDEDDDAATTTSGSYTVDMNDVKEVGGSVLHFPSVHEVNV
ncbi:DgyrCDS8821 [Dimorphilus gyrociliatus]|uniref:DgyrCDS8821 n=1 Tax=Dimorphilus gyrociliatus TaxID=2664684 RepID=A0A7I8VV94_9ANNE|nr:DgyrCDS8821 [Dimorphilus gyrociliatus]